MPASADDLFRAPAREHRASFNPLDPEPVACEKAAETRGTVVPLLKTSAAKKTTAKQPAAQAPTAKTLSAKTLTEGQRAYESKRAAKAGMSLDKWLNSKQREKEAEAKAKLKAVEATKPPKPPGFFGRLLERAQRPLGS
jgi:hypothetical protein